MVEQQRVGSGSPFESRVGYELAAATAHSAIFDQVRPASTMLVVSGLLERRWRVEVELDAILEDDPG